MKRCLPQARKLPRSEVRRVRADLGHQGVDEEVDRRSAIQGTVSHPVDAFKDQPVASRIMNTYTRAQELRTARRACWWAESNVRVSSESSADVCIHASTCPCAFPRQFRFFFSDSPSLWFFHHIFSLFFLFSHFVAVCSHSPSVFFFNVRELASDAIVLGLVGNLCSALSGKVATLQLCQHLLSLAEKVAHSVHWCACPQNTK